MIYNRKHGDAPAGAIYVGRPSEFGNPFSHIPGKGIECASREEAIDRFEHWLILGGNDSGLYRLRGKDLVCWCAPDPCHAEILEREANRGTLIAVTGHRPDKIGGYDEKSPQRLLIRHWLAEKASTFEGPMWITGGALGVDQDAAREAVKNGQPFMVAAPFFGQQSKWPKESQDKYLRMLGFADAQLAGRLHWTKSQAATAPRLTQKGVVTTYWGSYPGPWVLQKRNEWMVDRCDVLLGVWDGSDGGTSNCIAYATKIGKPVIWVDPNEL